ncbi:type I-E CRISPR-associated protein Cse2/CasB [Kitasatospora sp. MAP5-34]|uniref:type I-E CRISPR-associated protein Cse2/CasB n=1 Tax=Kitasatospora sp. MAP5-34 TaxID=3035102 RepID=UPI002474A285|nr:type I-E CRISPR-associated protein Cse2/CasB [Kitasatospora sp. MAP5-34]MDH6575189.1 CRISPR system Cascade subunit CasB [Kitasatospora sp. MAP5-34]
MSDTVTASRPDSSQSPADDRTGSPIGHARAFVRWIDQRCYADPGVRAALRRGVGRSLDDVPYMHRFVANWLTAEHLRDLDTQRAYYTVASLVAAQRRDQYAAASTKQDSGNPAPERPYGTSLGAAFATGVAKGTEAGIRESSAETRLNLLTRQSVNGLHRHLPGSVRQLRDKNVEVDWAQLLVDLSRWRRHSGSIKRRWLQDFYRARRTTEYDQARRADPAAPTD